MRTAKEILCQTEKLAREFYKMNGCVSDRGYCFRNASTPMEAMYWAMACKAQEILTETDIDDVIEELEN